MALNDSSRNTRLSDRRTRIVIKRLAEIRDDMGGTSNRLVTVAERWAKVEPLGGRVSYTAGALASSVSHRITIRYDAGLELKAAWFVELPSGAQLRIISHENIKTANVDTVILCETVNDYGGGK